MFVVVTNVLVLSETRIPFIGATLGFWRVIAWLPTYLLATTEVWHNVSGVGRGWCIASVE